MSLPFAIRKVLQALVLCIILFACIIYYHHYVQLGETLSLHLDNTLPLAGILIFGAAILFRFTHPIITGTFIVSFGSFLFLEDIGLNAPILSSVVLSFILLQWHQTERTHYHQFKLYRWMLWASTCLFIPLTSDIFSENPWLSVGLFTISLLILLFFELKRPLWITYLSIGLLLIGVFITGATLSLMLWIPAIICTTLFSQIHLERTHLPSQVKTTSLLILSTFALFTAFTLGQSGFEYALDWVQNHPVRLATLQVLID